MVHAHMSAYLITCVSIRYFMNAVATGCRADGGGHPPCGASDGGALRHPLHRGAMSPFHPMHPFYPIPAHLPLLPLTHIALNSSLLLIKTNRPLLTACVLPTVITTDFLLRVLTRYPPRSRPTCSSSRRSSARSANTPSTRAPRPSTTSTLCSGDLRARSLHA